LFGFEAERELIGEYDEIEIPPVRPYVIRRRRFACRCAGCGVVAKAPATAVATTTPFGLRLHALAIYLKGFQALSYERLRGLFQDAFGLRVSEGALMNMFIRKRAGFETEAGKAKSILRAARRSAFVQALQPGDWHLPFVSKGTTQWKVDGPDGSDLIKLSAACCASTSYKTVDGFDMTLDRAVPLHDKLVAATPLHASPCEHQCYADETSCGLLDGGEWEYAKPKLHGNLKGFVQYRKTLVGECQ
jgi:transposase